MEPTIDDIRSVTQQVWESVLGRDAAAGAPDPDGSRLQVEACVHITGGWEGTVSVATSDALARGLTEEMFGMSSGEASDAEILDANGEMANMIGGNIKALMPGPSQLSLPTVAHGAPMAFPGTTVAVTDCFDVDGEPFVVTVRRRASNAGDGDGSRSEVQMGGVS